MTQETHIDLIKQYLPKENLIFIDVGAFSGNYSIGIVKALPTTTVHAIEACPINYKALKKQTTPYPNIIPYNLAITDQDKDKVGFYTAVSPISIKAHGNVTSQSNSLYKNFLKEKKNRIENFKTIEVEGMTLDTFCAKNKITHIDLLKINCEGCEFKIFNTNTNFLAITSVIVIAIHGVAKLFKSQKYTEKRKHIINTIRSNGFFLVRGDEEITTRHMKQTWIKKKAEKEQ